MCGKYFNIFGPSISAIVALRKVAEINLFHVFFICKLPRCEKSSSRHLLSPHLCKINLKKPYKVYGF